MLLTGLAGCVTQRKVPLQPASLEVAKRQCHAPQAFFLEGDTIGFPGLFRDGDAAPDYRRQAACLSKRLQGSKGMIVFVTT
jgi:hypothetical protein